LGPRLLQRKDWNPVDEIDAEGVIHPTLNVPVVEVPIPQAADVLVPLLFPQRVILARDQLGVGATAQYEEGGVNRK
jgi:hypothetical protein